MKNLKFSFMLLGLIALTTIISCEPWDDEQPNTDTSCDFVTCYNGGVCKDGDCDCPPGYSGSECEIDNTGNSACVGVTCYNGGTCDCPPGYTGSNCQYEVDPCAGVSCVNGDLDSDCDCNCDDGWIGSDCSTPEPEDYTFIPDAIYDICPVHIGGDREFGGDGQIVTIRCNAFIVNNTSIYVHVYFHAIEDSPDWTEGLFEGDIKIYDAPNGKKINRITSSVQSHAYYVDTDHSFDYPPITNGNLVQSFQAIGDTGGNDLGQCINNSDAELNIIFNQMTIELVDE